MHLELSVADNLVGREIDLHCVVGLDQGIRVADGAAIVCCNDRSTLRRSRDGADAAKLIARLDRGDPMHDKATLGVMEKAEMLIGLVDRDNILEAAGIGKIRADLAVNLDVPTFQDNFRLLIGESVLKTVTDEKQQRNALAKLVGARRRTGSEDTRQFVKHPVLGRGNALHVLFRTASHFTYKTQDIYSQRLKLRKITSLPHAT